MKRPSLKTIRFFAVLGALLLTPLAQAQAVKLDEDITAGLVPHKALYEIQMVERHSGAPILDINGQMFYEWRPGCEAWTSDHRFKLLYEYANSAPIHVTSDFSTYENFDGTSFNYSSRRKRNGVLYEEVRGQAVMEENGSGKADYSVPADLSFDLPHGTLFPMAHTIELIRKARSGARFFNATVFDGSDEEGPVEINAFLGPRGTGGADIEADNNAIDRDLLKVPSWKIRMAFFPLANTEAGSDYEMEVVFHENGIISNMLVEYQDFSVTQKLVALEKVAPESCEVSDKKPAKRPPSTQGKN